LKTRSDPRRLGYRRWCNRFREPSDGRSRTASLSPDHHRSAFFKSGRRVDWLIVNNDSRVEKTTTPSTPPRSEAVPREAPGTSRR
jgi:hypothetical protein